MGLLFFIPAIMVTVFLGLLSIIFGLGSTSPIVFLWIVFVFLSSYLLSRDRFWGGIFGMLTGVHWIYLGTQDTGQMMNEMPVGIALLFFYLLASGLVFIKEKGKYNKK